MNTISSIQALFFLQFLYQYENIKKGGKYSLLLLPLNYFRFNFTTPYLVIKAYLFNEVRKRQLTYLIFSFFLFHFYPFHFVWVPFLQCARGIITSGYTAEINFNRFKVAKLARVYSYLSLFHSDLSCGQYWVLLYCCFIHN